MSEPKLIDANALNERFDKRIKWLQLDVHDQYSLGLYHGAVTDKDLINEMPTVDAVEVVRCKDCKYGEVDNADFHDQYLCNISGSDWNCGNHFAATENGKKALIDGLF